MTPSPPQRDASAPPRRGTPYCRIYVGASGSATVAMRGTVSRSERPEFIGAKVRYASTRLANEQAARAWVQLGRDRDGLEDMPEPEVIHAGARR